MAKTATEVGSDRRIAVTSHSAEDTVSLPVAGADLVLEPFQDAADRAVELLCGGSVEVHTTIPDIDSEGRDLA